MRLLKSIAFGFGIVTTLFAFSAAVTILLTKYPLCTLIGIISALATSLSVAHYLATKD
jgi:uncharacterized membrane protein